MNKIEWATEIFEKYGIKTTVRGNNQIIISHYNQPKGTTFQELGINEDELIENVIGCEGIFDTLKSQLTTFPLVVSREIRLYNDGKITAMPNLKAVGVFVGNKINTEAQRSRNIGCAKFIVSWIAFVRIS